MGKASYDYDTAAIRREARKIKSCYDRIEESALDRVKSARAKLEDNFVGRTADALDGSLLDTQSKLNTLKDELRGLYSALNRFADALEEADERVSKLFRS